jgi:hypothetical protein
MSATEAEIWGRTIHPDIGDLSPDTAREFIRWQLSNADAQRVRDLSDKANAGALNAEEENELDFYLNVARARVYQSEGASVSSGPRPFHLSRVMDADLQRAVRDRAGHRCEYCHFPEAFAEAPFHVDHVIARQHGGMRSLENLALACCFCNRYKGPNLSGVDSESGQVAPLFHPRRDVWNEHCRIQRC